MLLICYLMLYVPVNIFIPKFWRHIVITLSIPSVCPALCPVHMSYILLGRNPKFGVWMHLGIAECRVSFWVSVTLT